MNSIGDVAEEMERIRQEDSTKIKSISGMTALLLPNIRADFPEFNEEELYSKAESSLRQIFNAIENKDIKMVEKLPLMRDSISQKIHDYESNNITERFDDIVFHKFSLFQYEKKDGVATITVSIALEYYYQKKQNDKVLEDFTKYKRQTRYQCKFIYIYDETKVGDAKVLAINCPNCGAAIKVLGHKYCDYCGSAVQEVNLKSWEFSSYKEF